MRIAVYALVIAVVLPLSSFAQTIRSTWVSASGADTNDGSRNSPLRTFQAAHDATLPGGQVSCVDPANFGPVIISRSIIIDGAGTEASILTITSFGIAVNGGTGAPISVTLRNLDINGGEASGNGANGIQVSGSVILQVENCRIAGFGGDGISFRTSNSSSQLFVENTTIHHCGGRGVFVSPTSGGCTASLSKTSITACGSAGVRLESGANLVARDVVSNGNSGGFSVASGALATITACTANQNLQGLACGGVVDLIASDVIRNSGAGLRILGGGLLRSGKNNRVFGNHPDGTPNGVVTYK